MGKNIDNASWRKSSYSGSNGGDGVEIAVLSDDGRAVRDSKDPGGPGTGVRAGWVAGVHGGDQGGRVRPGLSGASAGGRDAERFRGVAGVRRGDLAGRPDFQLGGAGSAAPERKRQRS
jgi:hypothetical protein